jgi:hypothetical protein
MVELGFYGDEGHERGSVGPKLDVPTPLNGDGGFVSYDSAPNGELMLKALYPIRLSLMGRYCDLRKVYL